MAEAHSTAWHLLVFLWLSVGFAAGLQTLSGFGFALMVMPVLTVALGIRTAAPLVALLGWSLYLLNGLRLRHHVNWGVLGRLLAAAVLGLPFGFILLTRVPERWTTAGLGGVILAYLAYSLRKAEAPARPPGWSLYLAGFLGGALGGAYNTYGPPVIIYGHLAGWSKDAFRATLQGFFLVSATLVVVGHVFAGHVNGNLLALYAASLPALWAGFLVGRALDAHFAPTAFRVLVRVLLAALGFSLLLRGVPWL